MLEASLGNTSQIPYCSDQLVSVNVRNGIMVSVYRQGMSSATCVLVENSASKGRFYGNPGEFITESAFLNKYALVDFPVESKSLSVENVLLKAPSYMVFLEVLKLDRRCNQSVLFFCWTQWGFGVSKAF